VPIADDSNGGGNNTKVPTIYVLNAAALSKPHLIEQLTAEVISYAADYAVISESHLKFKHTSDAFAIHGYHLFRRKREAKGCRGGGVAIYASVGVGATKWKPVDDQKDVEVL